VTPPKLQKLTSNAERCAEANSCFNGQSLVPNPAYISLSGARTHEAPVPEGEPLGERVEGNVAARALGVVVGRAHLARGGVEAAAGGGGREACDGAGEHLYLISAVSLENSGIGAYFDVCCVGTWSGDWQCSARSNGCSCDVDVSWRCWLRGAGRKLDA
jgi:hypothetical protein